MCTMHITRKQLTKIFSVNTKSILITVKSPKKNPGFGNYGTDEFSTKMLEKDFQNAAYATIRGFVQKFERLGLLSSTKYGTRIKYKINT